MDKSCETHVPYGKVSYCSDSKVDHIWSVGSSAPFHDEMMSGCVLCTSNSADHKWVQLMFKNIWKVATDVIAESVFRHKLTLLEK